MGEGMVTAFWLRFHNRFRTAVAYRSVEHRQAPSVRSGSCSAHGTLLYGASPDRRSVRAGSRCVPVSSKHLCRSSASRTHRFPSRQPHAPLPFPSKQVTLPLWKRLLSSVTIGPEIQLLSSNCLVPRQTFLGAPPPSGWRFLE